MADRGTQVAVQDATSYDVDDFEHVDGSIGDFGDTFTGVYYGPW